MKYEVFGAIPVVMTINVNAGGKECTTIEAVRIWEGTPPSYAPHDPVFRIECDNAQHWVELEGREEVDEIRRLAGETDWDVRSFWDFPR